MEKIDELLANTYRDGYFDCSHFGSLVVVNDIGDIVYEIGNPTKMVFERSTTKIFKASNIVKLGVADKFDFNDKELALIAGSHSGEDLHLSVLKGMLEKVGVLESDLLCGESVPLSETGIKESIASDNRSLSQLHCNCSGEHAGYLAMCRFHNWDAHSYLKKTHPIHLCMDNYVRQFTGFNSNISAIDGCGLPNYYVSLYSMAAGMANFCGKNSLDLVQKRIINSICSEPDCFAGEGRFVSELIKSSEGKYIGKDGAEGLFTVGVPGSGIGVAVKVADGNHRAAIPIILDVLEKLGCSTSTEIDKIRLSTEQPICTNIGDKVGETISALNL